jgi:hypothetical protein
MARVRLDEWKVLEYAEALSSGTDEVLNRSLGIDEHCLSARAIVQILETGAFGEDLRHVSECRTCLENLAGVGSLNLQSGPDFVARALAAAQTGRGARVIVEHDPVHKGLPVILGRESPVVEVSEDDPRVTLDLDVVPAFPSNFLEGMQPTSFSLDGALVAAPSTETRLSRRKVDGAVVLNLQFQTSQLARRVRERLHEGHPVIDTVRLHGKSSAHDREFLGQATLEFRTPTRVK